MLEFPQQFGGFPVELRVSRVEKTAKFIYISEIKEHRRALRIGNWRL